MKLIPHKKKTWENGDCLYMNEFLFPFDKKVVIGKEVLHLSYLNVNVVKAAQKLGLDTLRLAMYECPYTDREYYWAIPMTMLTVKDSFLYKLYSKLLPDWTRNMALDREWNTEQFGVKYFEKDGGNIGDVSTALMGPGYTNGTSIMDGGGSIKYALAHLDTPGDFFIFATHIWCNK